MSYSDHTYRDIQRYPCQCCNGSGHWLLKNNVPELKYVVCWAPWERCSMCGGYGYTLYPPVTFPATSYVPPSAEDSSQRIDFAPWELD